MTRGVEWLVAGSFIVRLTASNAADAPTTLDFGHLPRRPEGPGGARSQLDEPPDNHAEYLAQAAAGLTPEGRKRVDELLDELARSASNHGWVVRFSLAREAEVDAGRADSAALDEPAQRLSEQELNVLTAGFMTIRDQETLDDVADWADAVLALLRDERT